MQSSNRSWLQALAVYNRRSVVTLFFLGFSAGLPYLLIFSTLNAWLRDEGVTRTAIGFFSWVGITYSIKILWAPVLDSIKAPILNQMLGHRRAWLLISQAGIIFFILAMAFIKPAENLQLVAIFAFGVAFFSATQDIVIDAFRIESDADEVQGALATSYFMSYRLALLFAGAGSLYFADIWSWSVAYCVMAVAMCVGVATTLLVSEPPHKALSQLSVSPFSKKGFIQAVIEPFSEFFKRNGLVAIWLLLFVGFYRISDITMGVMANPFYLDLGFSKSEIASVSKTFGFFMTILGSFVGGLFVGRYGVHRPLIFGAIAVAITNLLFSILATIGPELTGLAMTITADNFCGGFAGAAFIAYLSSLTNRAYTATQYALFSSLMTLPGKFLSGFSGVVVDGYGYVTFFIVAALMGVPAIILSLWINSREASLN